MIQHNNGVNIDDRKGSVDDGDHCRAAGECGRGSDRQQWWAATASKGAVNSDEGGNG